MNEVKLLLRGRRLGEEGRGRELRERAALSMRDMASLVGVHVTTLLRWEQGLERPGRESAIRWAEVCEEIQEELLARSGKRSA